MRFKKLLIVALTLVVAWCGLGIAPAYAEYRMPYFIDVDLTNQIVTVYHTKDGSVARQMLCSTGLYDHTPTGTWYMPSKERGDERTEWYYMPNQYTWVKYATKIYYAYFFHSFLFKRKDNNSINQESVEDFGVPASHGCIRLRVEDARFIAQNCLAGTRVRIYKSGEKDEDLRSLLYVSSFSEDDGITYQEFLGISPDALSYGARGEEVQELQLRLRDLGYYDGSVDGNYDTKTITAVKLLQEDLGLAQSGITSPGLKEVIFSADAPVSAGSITIQEGSSGPVVKKFQTALGQLGIYTGDIDSVYDADVVSAVKQLQRYCGYDVTGIATPEIQQLAYYEVSRIQKALGEDFTVEHISEEVNMAKMIFKKAKVNVRAKANTESAIVASLSYGDEVMVLATKGDWAQIYVQNRKGFMYKKYLEPFTKTNEILQYSGNGQTITLGNTVDELLAGKTSNEKQNFKDAYNKEKYLSFLDDPVEYATVNTGSDDSKLNMRAEADSASEVLAELPNGTKLRVLAKTDEWTRVGYDDQIGYLMNQYLTFSEGSASEVEDTTDALDTDAGDGDRKITAVIQPNHRDGSVAVYEKASTKSKVLGYLKGGKEVRVLEADENKGWAYISYNGNKGYMEDKNLTFRLD